jgi:CBS domain-containing protein
MADPERAPSDVAPDAEPYPTPRPAPGGRPRAGSSGRGRLRTVGEVMRPAVTTVERHAHLAAAAYLMKHGRDTAVVVTTDDESRTPVGIITEADVAQAVADGKNVNEVRIDQLGGREPVMTSPGATVEDAANLMLSAHVRHLPVVDGARLVGIVDIIDACRALLDAG